MPDELGGERLPDAPGSNEADEADAADHIAGISKTDGAEDKMMTRPNELDLEVVPGPANEPPNQ